MAAAYICYMQETSDNYQAVKNLCPCWFGGCAGLRRGRRPESGLRPSLANTTMMTSQWTQDKHIIIRALSSHQYSDEKDGGEGKAEKGLHTHF
jgi:hypothetical protein